MSSKTLVAALGQLRVSAAVEESVEKCAAFLEDARQQQVDIVCFPEATIGGYYSVHFDDPAEVDWRAVDKGVRAVRNACAASKVGAALGASVRKPDGKIYNVFLLISKSGRILGEYAKCHLMPSDTRCYSRGQCVDVYRFYRVPVGLQICYDQRFPEPWRLLGLRGAEVVFQGSYGLKPEDTWKIPVVEAHLRSRAAENGYFVVSVNAGGPFQNWGSVVYDPIGLEVARANYDQEELVPAELDLSKVTRTLLNDRRRDLAEIVVCV